MSTQITDRPPAEDAQRRGHMAALAVAEQIATVSPIAPTDIKVTCAAFDNGKPSVDVHFYHSPEGVSGLAEVLGGTSTSRPFREDDPRAYTSAELLVCGVPVLAWTLAAAEDAAVAA